MGPYDIRPEYCGLFTSEGGPSPSLEQYCADTEHSSDKGCQHLDWCKNLKPNDVICKPGGGLAAIANPTYLKKPPGSVIIADGTEAPLAPAPARRDARAAELRAPQLPATTGLVAEFPVPKVVPNPAGIAAGPDGNLWVTQPNFNGVARVTPAGAVTFFKITSVDSALPFTITAGADGNLWFTEPLASRVARVTPAGVFTHFFISQANRPNGIALGPGGNLWFANAGADLVGKVTPAGVATTFPLPSTGAGAEQIVLGPDGNLWLTELGADKIARVRADIEFGQAGAITEFALPAGAGPAGIAAGPDGNLWFTEYFADRIGRITPGGVITEFALAEHADPFGITAGPDGNLWFAETGADKIGRITPAGQITEFALPTAGAGPLMIASGPGGTLWFTEMLTGKVGRITTAGEVTEIDLNAGTAGPLGIAAGADGNLWFTEPPTGFIGRLTPGGTLTEFPPLKPGSQPSGIAAGPDGNLWFTDPGFTAIGRMTPAGVITEFPLPAVEHGFDPTPAAITAGSDGNLWFTDYQGGRIGKATTAGVVTLMDVPAGDLAGSVFPAGITAGPDGALWFTDANNGVVFRVTTAGAFSHFTPPSGGHADRGIVTGPDNNLWYTGFYSIGRLTTAGVFTNFPLPTHSSLPQGIGRGPDGNVWFTAGSGPTEVHQVGRITPAGVITLFTLPTARSGPSAIVTGPDEAMWFTEFDASQIGRLATPGVAGSCIASDTTLCIDAAPGDRRFAVTVHYATSQGGGVSGDAHVIPLSSLGITAGGIFYFTNATNPEMLLKVLDTCAFSDHYWAFYSAGTNFGLTTTVTDTVTGNVWTRGNPDRTAALPIQDLAALPCSASAEAAAPGGGGLSALFPGKDQDGVQASGIVGPGAGGARAGAVPSYLEQPSDSPGRVLNAHPARQSAGPCVPSDTRLCIDAAPGDKRFTVTVHYATSQGGGVAGDARAIPLSSLGITAGGIFYFTNATNPEMLLKVLDTCAFSDHYWVFYSAGTNFGLTTTITDTTTGNVWTKVNPDRTAAAPEQDLAALPCQ